MPTLNTFSRNVSAINLKFYPTHGGINTSLRENYKNILRADEMDVKVKVP